MTRYFLRAVTLPAVFDLHSGLNTLGRNPTNDHRIHEASVSSFHAEVTVNDDGSVTVRDLQSTNGTFINDEPVTEGPLLPGQILQFGSVTLRLEAEAVEIRVPLPTKPTEEPAGPVVNSEGALLCQRNPQLTATHRCSKCGHVFNVQSLRTLKLSGSQSNLLFCPDCDGHCEPIPGLDPTAGRKGLLARFTQTIRLGWKRR